MGHAQFGPASASLQGDDRQVASEKPRPISTSRQPVWPRKHAFVWKEFNPAATVVGLIARNIEADDFGSAQASGEAQKQHDAVAQTAQCAAFERLQHGEKIVAQDGFPLTGRGRVCYGCRRARSRYAGPSGRVVDRVAYSSRSAATGSARWSTPTCVPCRSRGLGRDIGPTICGFGGCGSNDCRRHRAQNELPVGGIGATGVCRTRCLDMIARTVGLIRVRARAVATA